MSDVMTTKFVLTHPVEIAFPPALHDKRKLVRQAGGAPKFVTVPASDPDGRWEATFLFAADHPNLREIKQLCLAIAESKQPGITRDQNAWQYPWQSADAFIAKQEGKVDAPKRDNDWLRGKVLLNAHTNLYVPRLCVLLPGRGVVDFNDDAARLTVKDKFYAGVECLAEFNFQWFNASNRAPPGVTCYLNRVLSLNRGERRAGGKTGQETFGAYIGHLSAISPTGGQSAEVEY